jgi:hypothetical protein
MQVSDGSNPWFAWQNSLSILVMSAVFTCWKYGRIAEGLYEHVRPNSVSSMTRHGNVRCRLIFYWEKYHTAPTYALLSVMRVDPKCDVTR